MWNEIGTFRAEFSRKIRNEPRFKMRWNLFRFVNWYGMFRQFRAKRNEINMNTQIMKTCLREQIIYKIEHKCLKCMDIALVSIDYFFLYRKIKTKNVLHRWFTMIKLNYDNKLKIYFIKIAQNIFFKNEQCTS
jgi:hypothetical protein